MPHHEAFLGLGSNIGDRVHYLSSAVESLESHPEIQLVAQSSVIETSPMGDIDQGDFLNQVVKIETTLTPSELLECCLNIERDHERIRDQKWGPRTLDIDILFFGDEVIWDPILMVPHPEVHKRVFMLEPLMELAPEHIHPVFKQSIKTFHNAL